MKRAELVFLAVFCAAWAVGTLGAWGLLPMAGLLNGGLYSLFGASAFLGWLAGNIFNYRRRGAEEGSSRRLFVFYLMGPPSLVYLLRAMAWREAQVAAPLVPLYALGIYLVFFLVPVTLSSPRTPPRQPRIGGR